MVYHYFKAMSTEITNQHIQQMLEGPGPDLIIISVSRKAEVSFWEERLPEAIVIHEDWPGGAGNALGTLYAFNKALGEADLISLLEENQSIFLYHTAGKGKRLAPLSLSEGNNKSAVRLPGMRLLEAVIQQTSIFAPMRRGRLSVFWGDQLFIPSHPLPSEVHHHIDILTMLDKLPTAEKWEGRALHKYGLICADTEGNGQQIEKIDHKTAQELINKGLLFASGGVGVSLGSFSLSLPALQALLTEFVPELEEKKIQLDTDPHLWMPMTLDPQTYRRVMATKGVDEATATSHYRRIKALKERTVLGHELLLGATNIGIDSYWWDFGTLSSYFDNLLLLTKEGHEADAMRAFFSLSQQTDSLLIDVESPSLTTSNSVLINVKAPAISASNALLYNVTDSEPIVIDNGVRADVQGAPIFAPLDTDGKADWETVLPNNPASFASLYASNEVIEAKNDLNSPK